MGTGPDELRARRERDVAALLSQISYLEEEIGLLRRKVADSPRQVRQLEERIAEAEGRAAFLSERNDKLAGTLRDAREQLVSLKEEVDRLGQPPVGLRHLPEPARRRHGRRLHRRPQAAGHALAERRGRGPAHRPGGHAQRGDEHRRGARLRARRRRRHAQGAAGADRRRDAAGAGHRAHRRGAGGLPRRLADRAAAARRRLAAAGVAVGLRLRADPEERGRGARPRRGPRHRLQRHRWPLAADRADPRRRRAAVPARRPVPRVRAAAAEGHPAVRPARLREDADRQGGGELAGQEGRGDARRRRHEPGEVVLPQHQGPRAAQQVRRRDRAAHPAGLPAGAGEGQRGHAGHRLLRRDGLDLPHARVGRVLRRRDRRSCRSC